MTARKYAAECGVELFGKLERKTLCRKVFDNRVDKWVVQKVAYYQDEKNTKLYKWSTGWELVTEKGEVY